MGDEYYNGGVTDKAAWHATLYRDMEDIAEGLGEDLEPLFAGTWEAVTGNADYEGGKEESMGHATEMSRIYAADEAAREIIDRLPKEVVERCGVANLLSDLSHEFLMSGLPSRELQEQMHGQIQADGPNDDTLPEN